MSALIIRWKLFETQVGEYEFLQFINLKKYIHSAKKLCDFKKSESKLFDKTQGNKKTNVTNISDGRLKSDCWEIGQFGAISGKGGILLKGDKKGQRSRVFKITLEDFGTKKKNKYQIIFYYLLYFTMGQT